MFEVKEQSDYETRFSGIGRLYGRAGWERLRRAHVCVVGVGGVGSWAVEALARSGVGTLTLIDLDEVCLSNTNRQLPALAGNIGRTKVEVLAARVGGINPECVVHQAVQFFTPSTADQLLAPSFDYVLDAIDSVANKALLIASCRAKRLPIVTVGAAGGKRDATAIKVSDLAQATHDRLFQKIRKILRVDFGFPENPKINFEVDAVFSTEPVTYPQPDGTVCGTRDPGSELRLNCESGYGTATFVTGTFGFVAAGRIVQMLVEQTSK